MPASCSRRLWRQTLHHCSMDRLQCSGGEAATACQPQQALLLGRCWVLKDRRQAVQVMPGNASHLSQHGMVPGLNYFSTAAGMLSCQGLALSSSTRQLSGYRTAGMQSQLSDLSVPNRPSGKAACRCLLAREPASTFWQGSPAEPAAYESVMLLLSSTRGLELSPPTRGLQLSPPACPCRCCCTRRMPRTGRRRPGWSTSTSSPARIRSSLWNGHWR